MAKTNEFKLVKNVKAVGDGLYLSTNYDIFHFYKGNRYTLTSQFDGKTVSKQEAKDAKKKQELVQQTFEKFAKEQGSVDKFLFDKDCPILIAKLDGEYLIVEGQNRFSFCTIMNIPFYFRMLNIRNYEELMSFIHRYNFSKSAWTKSQQIGSEARLGNVYAQEIINIGNTYDIPQSNILYFTQGKSSHKMSLEFTVKPFDIELAHEKAKAICNIANNLTIHEKNYKALISDNRFTNFVVYMIEKGRLDILEKVSKTKKITKIKGATCIENYGEALGVLSYMY